MKTTKTFFLALALLVVTATVNAMPLTDAATASPITAVNTYIDAMTRGRLDGFNSVVDASAKFNMLRGSKVQSFSKKEMLDFVKGDKGVTQDCTTSTSVVDSNANVAVIKVDMKYSDFTRSNYVTVANTGDGWKITNVYSVFK